MDLYDTVSYDLSRRLTLSYSSSFGIGSRFFAARIRRHIYAIYGLVRIADEIVDTYRGPEAARLLDELEHDTNRAVSIGYSANPIVQAYARTARHYAIDPAAMKSFFDSMRMDLTDHVYTPELYKHYIHGSAEVIGLMCLSVFCEGDQKLYKELSGGAMALGSAYQKVNFLRDIGSDQRERERLYFPGCTFDSFDDAYKSSVIADIESDLAAARAALPRLPRNSRTAVYISYVLYATLLAKLRKTSAAALKQTRVRISTPGKLWLALYAIARSRT